MAIAGLLFGFGSGHDSDSFYLDLSHDPLWFRPLEIDGKQAVFQLRILHLDTVRQDKSALELASGDAAVEIGPGAVIDLTAPDHELVFLEGDFKLVARESGDRERDAEFLWRIFAARYSLDIIGRIAVIGRFCGPVEDPLEIIESEADRGWKTAKRASWRALQEAAHRIRPKGTESVVNMLLGGGDFKPAPQPAIIPFGALQMTAVWRQLSRSLAGKLAQR